MDCLCEPLWAYNVALKLKTKSYKSKATILVQGHILNFKACAIQNIFNLWWRLPGSRHKAVSEHSTAQQAQCTAHSAVKALATLALQSLFSNSFVLASLLHVQQAIDRQRQPRSSSSKGLWLENIKNCEAACLASHARC